MKELMGPTGLVVTIEYLFLAYTDMEQFDNTAESLVICPVLSRCKS